MSCPYLPSSLVELVLHALLEAPDSETALLSVVACAGVCREWRGAAADAARGRELHFSSLQHCTRQSLGRQLLPREQAFKDAPAPSKACFFQHAARLFTGYTRFLASGSGVSDILLLEVARRTCDHLTDIAVRDAPDVTDLGLGTLVLLCGRLQAFTVARLPRVLGGCLGPLLDNCPALRVVALDWLPGLNWAAVGRRRAAAARPAAVHTLRLHNVGADPAAEAFFATLGGALRALSYEGPPSMLRSLAACCPGLEEVRFAAASRAEVDEVLLALFTVPTLRTLEVTPKGFCLAPEQLHLAGLLPVTELRLDSYLYHRQPCVGSLSHSHVDNEGVRALVDAVCRRWFAGKEVRPFKLSLCGATALTQYAVSALLRLPLLTDLKIDGCCKITAMDKMRLVAKVKAGRELLESSERELRRAARAAEAAARAAAAGGSSCGARLRPTLSAPSSGFAVAVGGANAPRSGGGANRRF